MPQWPAYVRSRSLMGYPPEVRDVARIGSDWTGKREVVHVMYRQLDANHEAIPDAEDRRVATLVCCGVQPFSEIVGMDRYLVGIPMGSLIEYLEMLEDIAAFTKQRYWASIYATRRAWLQKHKDAGAVAYPILSAWRSARGDVDTIDINGQYFQWLVPSTSFPFSHAPFDRLANAPEAEGQASASERATLGLDEIAALVAAERWMVCDHFDIAGYDDRSLRMHNRILKPRTVGGGEANHPDNPASLRFTFDVLTRPLYAKERAGARRPSEKRPDFDHTTHEIVAELAEERPYYVWKLFALRALLHMKILVRACTGDGAKNIQPNPLACEAEATIRQALLDGHGRYREHFHTELRKDFETLPADSDERFGLEQDAMENDTTAQLLDAEASNEATLQIIAPAIAERRRLFTKELDDVHVEDGEAVQKAIEKVMYEAAMEGAVGGEVIAVGSELFVKVRSLASRRFRYLVVEEDDWDPVEALRLALGLLSMGGIGAQLKDRAIERTEAFLEDDEGSPHAKTCAKLLIKVLEGELEPSEVRIPEPDEAQDAPVH